MEFSGFLLVPSLDRLSSSRACACEHVPRPRLCGGWPICHCSHSFATMNTTEGEPSVHDDYTCVVSVQLRPATCLTLPMCQTPRHCTLGHLRRWFRRGGTSGVDAKRASGVERRCLFAREGICCGPYTLSGLRSHLWGRSGRPYASIRIPLGW